MVIELSQGSPIIIQFLTVSARTSPRKNGRSLPDAKILINYYHPNFYDRMRAHADTFIHTQKNSTKYSLSLAREIESLHN